MQTTSSPSPKQRQKPGRTARLHGLPGDAVRVLDLREGGRVGHYYLEEVPADGGRGFFFQKFHTERKPGEGSCYHVLIAATPAGDTCECLGHLRWGHKTVCKHRASLRGLIAAGRLPAPPAA